MGRRRHVFLNETTGEELVLPVTPSSWSWGAGNDIVLTQTEGMGDINLPGRRTLTTETITGFFPSQVYNFCEPEAVADPGYYTDWFSDHAKAGTILRYLVSETTVNAQVLIASVAFGETGRDGSVSYTITLREYDGAPSLADLTTVTSSSSTSEERTVEPEAVTTTHTVVSGDNLWMLCKYYYGETSTSLCNRVASHNGIANINLIYVGQVIEFPPIDSLTTSTITTSTAQALVDEEPLSVTITVTIQGDSPGLTSYTYTSPTSSSSTTVSTKIAQTRTATAKSGGAFSITRTPDDGNSEDNIQSYMTINGYRVNTATFSATPTVDLAIVVQY